APIDVDPALGQPLRQVGVAEAVADVPPDGQRDHVVSEAAPGEGTGRASREPAPTLVAAPALPAQPSLAVPSGPSPAAPDAPHRPPLSTASQVGECTAHPTAT